MNNHGALRWHSFGLQRHQAWSTHDGGWSPHWFQIDPTHEGWRLEAQQVGTGAPALPVLVMLFVHGEWTVDAVQAIAERLRPSLPALGPESWMPIARVEAQIAERMQRPTRCYFRHIFPLGAVDSTACECGKLTKGFYEASRAKEAERGTYRPGE